MDQRESLTGRDVAGLEIGRSDKTMVPRGIHSSNGGLAFQGRAAPAALAVETRHDRIRFWLQVAVP
jgi:hypothetical protein